MITRRFIEKVHDAFDELNYHETRQLDYDDFQKAAVSTLTHCEDLSDAINAVYLYRFCLNKWSKIEKLFNANNKLSVFNEYDFEGNALIDIVSDEDALGTYYITNGITKKIKEIFVASFSFDDEIFALDFGKGRFTVFTDGEYYMKYSKLASDKMKLFDYKNHCLCNIVLSKNLGVFLENNSTQYELVEYDDFIGIYERSYIDGLSDTDYIDPKKLIADIEWDILEKNSDFGVAKLNVYAHDHDLEMFLFFSAATFLAFQRYKKGKEWSKGIRAGRNAAITIAALRR